MGRLINEIGNRYGLLTVIRDVGRGQGGKARWFCVCDCGGSVVVRGDHLRSGNTTSCGCYSNEFVDEIGNRYGRLVVVEEDGRNKHRSVLWFCQCDCGNIVTVIGRDLRRGRTRSCGCLHRDICLKEESGNRYGRLVVIERVASAKDRGATWLCKCDCGKEIIVSGKSLRSGDTRSCGCLVADRLVEVNTLPNGVAGFNKLYASYKRGAKMRNLFFGLTKKEFKELTQKACSYCGAEPQQVIMISDAGGAYTYNGIDRIDNNRGYVLDNVVPCCGLCNRTKGALSVNEFFRNIKKIYNHSIAKESQGSA